MGQHLTEQDLEEIGTFLQEYRYNKIKMLKDFVAFSLFSILLFYFVYLIQNWFYKINIYLLKMGSYISKSDLEEIENIILSSKKGYSKIYTILAITTTLILLYLIFCNMN